MSKFNHKIFTLILIATLLPVTSVNAATKLPAGQVCKKKSAVTKFEREKYICKLVGKKLIWTLKKKVSTPPVLSWAEIAAKTEADKAIADAKAAAEKAAAEKAAAEKAAAEKAAAEKAAQQAREAAEKAALLEAQKPVVAGLQIGKLLWSDEFVGVKGTSINTQNWSARNCHRVPVSFGGGACFGAEVVYYAPSAIALDGSEDGAAVISTKRVSGDLPADAGICMSDYCAFVSGRFDTHGKVAFQYGFIEARIKMPAGSGNHPAFWMLGENINQVGWPNSGEMDITEIRGNDPYTTTSATHSSTAFLPNVCCGNHFYKAAALGVGADVSSSFHTYAVAWLPDSIAYYVDNRLISVTTPQTLGGHWGFNNKFFLILNNAVNAVFSGSWGSLQSSTMSIDWVRSYQLNGQGQIFTR